MSGCNNKCGSKKVEDVCKVCGGDGKSCLGCDGVANSGKANDSCGVCDGDGMGCKGCDGVENSGKVNDCAGACGGTAVLSGCDNTCGSTKKKDVCSVCGGDGFSCKGGGSSSNANGGTGNTAGAGGTAVVGGNGTGTGDAAEGSMLIIVGAACGGAVFLAFVVLLSIFFLYKRNNKNKRPLSKQAGRNGMEMSGHQARPKSMAPSFPRPESIPRGVNSKLTGGLPNGWVSAIDESSGETYYYHEETAETQWEFPMAPRLAPEAPVSTTMHPNPINNDASGARPVSLKLSPMGDSRKF